MYAILRTKKLKSIAAVSRSAQHTFREQPTPNANPAKTHENRYIGANSSTELLSKLKLRLPEKRRKDAVVCIEYLITASPEAFKRHGGHLNDMGSGYFKNALSWLKERHGASNVICAGIHQDETSPHLVAYVVPMTKDDRLAARDFLGGPKVMRQLQDSFHSRCGVSYGLLRGVQASKAKHEDVGRFYNALTRAKKAPKLTSLDYAKKALGYETANWKAAVEVAQASGLASVNLTRQRKSTLSRIKALDAQTHKARGVDNQLSGLREELARREEKLRLREVEASELRKKCQTMELQVGQLKRLIKNNLLDRAPLSSSKQARSSLDNSLEM